MKCRRLVHVIEMPMIKYFSRKSTHSMLILILWHGYLFYQNNNIVSFAVRSPVSYWSHDKLMHHDHRNRTQSTECTERARKGALGEWYCPQHVIPIWLIRPGN